MKLLLHWLRWDLRRFRLLLFVWTLLVLGYAAFLGWLHQNILTVDPAWMEWSQPIALVLAVVEVILLLHLLSTDPALGTDPFWKTRPPRGFAVAGAKMVMVMGFFAVLPMAAWWTMTCWSVPPGAVTHGWGETSWTLFLWWWHAFLIGTISLGASVIRHPRQILLAVAAAFALSLMPMLVALILKPAFLDVMPMVLDQAVKAFTQPVFAGWLLLAGCLCFWLARTHRTPSPWWRLVVVLFPAVLLVVVPLKPEAKRKILLQPETPNVTAASTIRVGGLQLRKGLPVYSLPKAFAMDEEYPWAEFEMQLQVTGLPDDLPAVAGWRTLKLTAPDGRVLQGNEAMMQARTIRRMKGGTANLLPVSGAIFDVREVIPFSLLPCRAEGTLRVMLQRKESVEWVPAAGSQLAAPMAQFEMPEDEFNGHLWQGVLRWTPMGPGELGNILIQLRKTGTGERLPVSLNDREIRTGFLLQRQQHKGHLRFPMGVDFRSYLRQREFQKGFPVSDWALELSWQQPDGYVDIPVVVEPFILPRQKGDARPMPDLIRAVSLEGNASTEQIRLRLTTLLMLANQPASGSAREAAVEAALEEKLGQLAAPQLPLLLEAARSGLIPAHSYYPVLSDGPLKRRLLTLLQPSDLVVLETEKELFAFLEAELRAAGLVTAEPEPKVPAAMSDAELEDWDLQNRGRPEGIAMLQEAARRGLPWAFKSILHVIEIVGFEETRFSNRSRGLLRLISTISDCPEDFVPAKIWLKENGDQLVWDATLKRWVLPPGNPDR